MAENEINSDGNEIKKTETVLPIVVRTFFTDIVEDDGNVIVAARDLCKPRRQLIRGQHKVPSNFTKHVKVCTLAISITTVLRRVSLPILCTCFVYSDKEYHLFHFTTVILFSILQWFKPITARVHKNACLMPM